MASKSRSVSPNDTSVVDLVAQLSFEVMGRLTKLAAEEDLSLTQLRLLGILRDRRPRMAELADALGLDRSSVTGLVSRAERRGWVQRTPVDGDGRGIVVELTRSGRTFASVIEAKVADRLADFTAPLDGLARDVLPRILASMLTASTSSPGRA